MPKSPKISSRDRLRHNPLTEDYSPSENFKQKAPKKRKQRDENADTEHIVDTKAARKILIQAQGLADEAEAERKSLYVTNVQPSPFDLPDQHFQIRDEDEEDVSDPEAWEDDEHDVEVEETDVNDLSIFDKFNPSTFDDPLLHTGLGPTNTSSSPEPHQSRNLADLILAKIAAVESGQLQPENLDDPDAFEDQIIELDPKVVQVYTQIGHLLSRHRSGKLPKAFKIIPTLPPAMQSSILPLTRPESWTPQAIYAATRIFISGPSVTAQAFLGQVLLDRVRDALQETRKLNVHLYASLRKSLYKPAAFFKGLLFPLLQSGNATLREATIVASVLTRVSVPVLHSAAALARLCEIASHQMSRDVNAAGPTNICIRALLEKRYALPYQTIDALVFHFLRFRPSLENSGAEKDEKLPVLWHQCLLVFAQRYRNEISEEQREALLDLLLVRGHREIGPEIRRELLAGRGRGTLAVVENAIGGDGDDTLMT